MPLPMSDDPIGQVVDGYRIQGVLGRGGMGVVYKAEDVALSRPVAIKRVNPSQGNRDMFLHRFRSEARALARIDSPHIVSVYALRETDLGLLIVMEYVDGGTLDDRIQGKPMPVDEALPILKQMLQAFGDAHRAGVIHRDIKPQNIMLTQDSMVKVTDFGIAKMRKQDTGKTVTQGGQGGTLKYMSPEQISDIEAVNDTSDIYALGMVAYQMLVGTLPFEDTETDFDIMRKVVEGRLPSPTEYRDDLPAPLVELIATATAKKQEDRYASTDEMMAVLNAFEQDAGMETTAAPLPKEPTGTGTPPAIDVTDMPEAPPEGETVLANSSASSGNDASNNNVTATAPAIGGETVLAPSNDDATSEPGGVQDETADTSADDASSAQVPWLWIAAAVATVGLVGSLWALGGNDGDSAMLSVTTMPDGAVVYVGGDSVGVTPLQNYAAQAAGPVQVRIAKEGYVPRDTTLALAAATTHTLRNLTLSEEDVRLRVDTDPDARVFVDEQAVGTAPLDSTLRISPGEHTVRIEKDGYAPFDTTVVASSGSDSVRVSASLQPARADNRVSNPSSPVTETATVRVQAQPRGTITVAGQSATNQGRFEVAAGRQQVTCTHPEYGSVQTTVTLQAGQTEQLQCYFEHAVYVNAEPWGGVWINNEQTDRITPTEELLYLGPGTHEVQVRVERQDRILSGGLVRIIRGDTQERERFSGYTYTLTVEPSFEPVEYRITFTD